MPEQHRLLELALKGLEADRARIDDESAEIKRELRLRPTVGTTNADIADGARPRRKRRKMSAEARKKISEGMKRRYAQLRKAVKK